MFETQSTAAGDGARRNAPQARRARSCPRGAAVLALLLVTAAADLGAAFDHRYPAYGQLLRAHVKGTRVDWSLNDR